MVLLMTFSAFHDTDTIAVTSHDTNTNANGIMQCQCWIQWYQMTKKSHVAPHFDHQPNKGMVSFTMPLSLCDVHTGTNGITWPKMSCYNSF